MGGHSGVRHWLAGLVSAVLLAGGLAALFSPVYLDSYDGWGIQIKCGSGYRGELLQATIDDQQPAVARPASSYVDRCNSALAHRRTGAAAVAGLGALLLVPELVAWARGGSQSPRRPPASTNTWPGDPTEDMEHAAVLDRRYRRHRARPSNTTL